MINVGIMINGVQHKVFARLDFVTQKRCIL